MARQPDGKLVVAGGNGRDFALVRYHANGTLDRTFSGDGKLTTDFAGGHDSASGAALQPNGKIVAAGSAGGAGMAVARYNPDGSLDRSFSRDGRQTIGFGGDGYARDVALQRDGRIVLAGSEVSSECPERDAGFALARLTSRGSLDDTFSGDGKLTTNFACRENEYPEDDSAHAVGVAPDGRLVAVGNVDSNLDWFGSVGVARYKTDGTLDRSFSGDGKLELDPGWANDVVVRRDGRIVLAGWRLPVFRNAGFLVARLNADGTPDKTFSRDGQLQVDFGRSFNEAHGVALAGEGKVVVAGRAQGRFALARVDRGGSLDRTFSGDGKLLTAFPEQPSVVDGSSVDGSGASDVLVAPDGRIVAAGYARLRRTPTTRFAVARYR